MRVKDVARILQAKVWLFSDYVGPIVSRLRYANLEARRIEKNCANKVLKDGLTGAVTLLSMHFTKLYQSLISVITWINRQTDRHKPRIHGRR